MKRILVPTDFSSFALDASKTAAKIARKNNAEIIFLHVVSLPSYESGVLPFQDAQNIAENLFILKLVRKNFEELFASDFLKGIKVVEAVSYSAVYDSITENTEKHGIDMIVMGTHGTSGYINDYFIGSNTDKVIRKSKVPVIAVKSYSDVEFNKVLFAGDFSDSLEKNFEPIKDFANNYNAELMLLHVVTKGDFYYTAPMMKRIDEFAKKNNLKKYSCHVFNAESVQQGINEFAQLNDVDLIATITSGRRGLSRLLNGSVTEDVMHKVDLPVLTIKA
jgi:nucleotide-binding universal stress UspA family protein